MRIICEKTISSSYLPYLVLQAGGECKDSAIFLKLRIYQDDQSSIVYYKEHGENDHISPFRFYHTTRYRGMKWGTSPDQLLAEALW